MLIHNHALKYLSEKIWKKSFWASAPLLHAIKPKFENYLKGIDYRFKLLAETPREEIVRGSNKISCKGLFSEYICGKSYQQQAAKEISIELAMDERLCILYSATSKAFAQYKDIAGKDKMENLANMCVMELQFMHGCDVEWNLPGGAAGDAPPASQFLQPANNGDDDNEKSGESSSDGEDGEASDEVEPLDFASIDPADVLTSVPWEKMEYPDHTKFLEKKESFAMAMLFFLDEELQCKFPKLSGQVHAGWKHEFKRPVTIDQLLDRPEKISFMFEEREELWFRSTMQHFITAMNETQRENLGISAEHLQTLEIVCATSSTSRAEKPQASNTTLLLWLLLLLPGATCD